MADRSTALGVLEALRRTPVGDGAVLVGSSGLFGFETGVPALTEDIDIAIPEVVAESEGSAIVAALEAMGFVHEAGTATFVRPDGMIFDLLGHGEPESGDHVAGHGRLRVMVFADLSWIITRAGAVATLPGGGRALTPAGFVAAKLLTERGHKGAKDKLQALLVLGERANDAVLEGDLVRLLSGVEGVRREDVRASAQEALLALGGDPFFRDAGAEGYAPSLAQVERGFAGLQAVLDRIDG